MRYVLIAMVLALGAMTCDMTWDVHDNDLSVELGDICHILNPPGACYDDAAMPVPRLEGQPCNFESTCADMMTCACGVCMELEDLGL